MKEPDFKTANKKELVPFFIKMFRGIPNARWCTYFLEVNGQRCAFGHCGITQFHQRFVNPKSRALAKVFGGMDKGYERGVSINNGRDPSYHQRTPKARILAALSDIKTKLEAA